MKKNKKTYDDDDGRVIAPMNLEGMPWNNPGRWWSPRAQSGVKPKIPPQGEVRPDDSAAPQSLSRRETLAIALNAALAGLCVALILGGCGFVFIWILTHLWG
ncbi:MAG: hypothetical protein WCQ72_00665 [Eubacteriales bacterium]